MQSVMISIQPVWVEKILSGEKTVEVRKTKPKLQVPFKCYIYSTQGKSKDLGEFKQDTYLNRQKVVAEFTCDEINLVECDSEQHRNCLESSCLTLSEILNYCNGQDLYGWHISDLVVYDKPKELSEFKQCHKCEYGDRVRCNQMEFSCDGSYNLNRPPQSWCYVEEG